MTKTSKGQKKKKKLSEAITVENNDLLCNHCSLIPAHDIHKKHDIRGSENPPTLATLASHLKRYHEDLAFIWRIGFLQFCTKACRFVKNLLHFLETCGKKTGNASKPHYFSKRPIEKNRTCRRGKTKISFSCVYSFFVKISRFGLLR